MITLRTTLLAAGAVVPVALANLFGISPWLVLGLAVLAIGLIVLLDRSLAGDPRQVRVSRDGDRRVRLGESAEVSLTVSNGNSDAVQLLLRDSWVPSAGMPLETHELALGPGEEAVFTTRVTPTRRGDRPAVRVTVRSFGPMRLAYKQADHHPEWTLRVLPNFLSRKHLPEKLAKLRQVEGSSAVRGRGQGTEFDTLREYVPGDDVRSIDWRATARRKDVMLRTYRPERSRRVVCVLDTGRTSAVRVGNEPRLDAAMDASLLLGALAVEAGDQVDLIAVDHRVRAMVTGTHGRSLLPKLVDTLAPLHPAMVETDFELVTGEILRRERKRSLVVLFTALEPGALGEGLLPVLPQLAARHKVIVAAVHDPVLDALANTAPTSASAVYDRAAGARALADRAKVTAALARHGVTVLDCPLDTFASQVCDGYLALKAAGQL